MKINPIAYLFTQTVTILPYIKDVDGIPMYDSERTQTRKCRIELNKSMISSGAYADGVTDTIHASALMFCTGDPIPCRSIVTYKDKDFIVTSCKPKYGFGMSHLEVTME